MVGIQLGEDAFDIYKINGTTEQAGDWKFAQVQIGQIHTDFSVTIRAHKASLFLNALAIDDIQFVNCTFPQPATDRCDSSTQFQCVRNGACIDRNLVCDSELILIFNCVFTFKFIHHQ